MRFGRVRHEVDLPPDVLLSVQEVTRAARRSDPQAPPWLKRVLPKSGLAGRLEGPKDRADDYDDDDPEFDDSDEREFVTGGAALAPVSFDVHAGHGVAIAGPDTDATLTLRRILTGMLPPTDGRVVVRGRLVALAKTDLNKFTGETYDKKAVLLLARFLGWPAPLIKARWGEILEFARLEELQGLAPRPHRNKTKQRLIWSAALHMDATLFVLDEGIPSDDEFADRAFALLEQRKSEGAAIVQRAGPRVDEVARLCDEVLWIEDGKVTMRGRPGEVARHAEKTRKEELHPLSKPILAEPPEDLPRIGSDGGTIEIELQVLRKELQLALALELSDHRGHEAYLENPARFQSEVPGHHRLRIFLPGGLLPDGIYQAKLLGEFAVPGSPPTPPRRVVSFEVLLDGYEDDAQVDADDVQFEVLPEPGDEEPATESEVEWDVGRTAV